MSASPSRSRFQPFWGAVGLTMLAILLCYGDSLTAPFVFDDVPAIVENPRLRSFLPDEHFWSAPQSALSGRPLAAFSFAVNYAVDGLNPRGYRLVNLLLHAATACLLAGWIRRTIAESPQLNRYADRADLWAAIIALLWAVHPLNSEAVVYIVQRTELSAAMFYVLAMYAGARAWRSDSRAWPITAVAACWLGTACKEIVVTAPIALVVYDQVFFPDDWDKSRRARLRLYVGMASSWLLFLLLLATGPRSETVGFHLGTPGASYLFLQAGVLLHYLRLAVVPYPLCGDYGDITAMAWCDPYILPGLLLIGGLFVATIYLWRRDRRWAFLGIWFFLILAPSSSFVPITSEPAAERRMYLPLIACIAAQVVATDAVLSRLLPRHESSRRILFAGAALLAIVAIGGAMLRVGDYRTDRAFWENVAYQMPDNHRAMVNLGKAYENLGMREEAGEMYRLAIVLSPEFPAAHHNLGLHYFAAGRYETAAAEFRAALDADPHRVESRAMLGTAWDRLGRSEEALVEFTRAVAIDGDSLIARIQLGNALARRGRYAEALDHFTRAVELDPRNETAAGNLVQVRADMEQSPHAQAVVP